jgi:hypothetical protein
MLPPRRIAGDDRLRLRFIFGIERKTAPAGADFVHVDAGGKNVSHGGSISAILLQTASPCWSAAAIQRMSAKESWAD